jgi:hypothetical protein
MIPSKFLVGGLGRVLLLARLDEVGMKMMHSYRTSCVRPSKLFFAISPFAVILMESFKNYVMAAITAFVDLSQEL